MAGIRLRGVILLAILASTSVRGKAEGFGATVELGPGIHGQVAAGDLNRDGKVDLVTGAQKTSFGGYGGAVAVFRNKGVAGVLSRGSFDSAQRFETGRSVVDIQLEDMDGDGLSDVVAVMPGGISFLRNTSDPGGAITFAEPIDLTYGRGSHPTRGGVVDFDGDGRLDSALTIFDDHRMVVLANRSAPGDFGRESFPIAADFEIRNPMDFAAGDVDGDGKPDIIVIGGSGLWCYRNTTRGAGSISFSEPISVTVLSDPKLGDLPNAMRERLQLADMDGDGANDLLSAISGHGFVIMRNLGSPEKLLFDEPVWLREAAYSMQIEDYDLDGKPDLGGGGQGMVRFLYNRNVVGRIDPALFETRDIGHHAQELRYVDLDGDGLRDLVLSSYSNVVVRRQETVRAPGTPPTISAMADQVIEEDGVAGPIEVVVGDVETAPGDLQLLAYSSNPSFVPNQNIQLGGSGSSRTVTVAPVRSETGEAVVTVLVVDGEGRTSSSSFQLAVNRTPRVSVLYNRRVLVNKPVRPIEFLIYDPDSSASELVVRGFSSNTDLVPEANIRVEGSDFRRALHLHPVEDQSGTTSITLEINDGLSSSRTSFELQVLTSFNDIVVDPPRFLSGPEDQVIEPGQTAVFEVKAVGQGALEYQWFFNEHPIPGATFSTLTIPNAGGAEVGDYRVRVKYRDAQGEVISEGAVLLLVGRPGGTIMFLNRRLPEIDAPVSDMKGEPVSGSDYAVQMYAGPDRSELAPTGPAAFFQTGAMAGYWSVLPTPLRRVPTVAPGEVAFVQARVWETRAGGNFEEAVVAGGLVGVSEVLAIRTGGGGTPPGLPTGLTGLGAIQLAPADLLDLGIRPGQSSEAVPANIALSVGRGETGAVLRVEVDPGRIYRVQTSQDLVRWETMAELETSESRPEFPLPSLNLRQQFFRVIAVGESGADLSAGSQ